MYAPERLDEAFRGFLRRDDIRFIELDMGREISASSDFGALRRLMEIISAEGPFDVVHGHSSKGGALARMAARFGGHPVVYTPHSMIVSSPDISRRKATVYKAIERGLGYGATSRMIAVSADEAEFMRKLRVVPESRIRVIPNALREEDFAVFERRDSEKNDPEIIFGSTMRFSEQKAPQNLIRAFARVKNSNPESPLRLEIAGDGELLGDCVRLVSELGLTDDVSLPGWVASPGGFLAGLDVFVVSSHYEAGVSYSTMEAMAAGLPVVSTRVFGAGMVEATPGNRVVRTGDVEELSRAMGEVAVAGREVLQATGAANHRFARENFDQELATRRTLSVYDELVRASS